MFLARSRFSLLVIGISLFAYGAHGALTELTLPPEIVAAAAGIQKEKSRVKRIELLTGMIAEVKSRVRSLPESIDESEIARVQILFELDILFGTLHPEKINPATCSEVQRSIRDWANPSGSAESEISPSGRLALEVVKSVCAP
jgi:hypothetical protein